MPPRVIPRRKSEWSETKLSSVRVSDKLQELLLRESNLDLKKATEICRAFEITSRAKKEMSPPSKGYPIDKMLFNLSRKMVPMSSTNANFAASHMKQQEHNVLPGGKPDHFFCPASKKPVAFNYSIVWSSLSICSRLTNARDSLQFNILIGKLKVNVTFLHVKMGYYCLRFCLP